MVTKFSFRQNLRGVSNQKTYLTKVIKEYAHMMEIPCRPLNIVSIDDNKFILSQSSFNGKGSDVSSLARFFNILSIQKDLIVLYQYVTVIRGYW